MCRFNVEYNGHASWYMYTCLLYTIGVIGFGQYIILKYIRFNIQLEILTCYTLRYDKNLKRSQDNV